MTVRTPLSQPIVLTGVAAVAAAIGAARGQPVPVLDAADPVFVSVRPVALDDLRNDDGTVRAFVQAASDGGHMTSLELAIHARSILDFRFAVRCSRTATERLKRVSG